MKTVQRTTVILTITLLLLVTITPLSGCETNKEKQTEEGSQTYAELNVNISSPEIQTGPEGWDNGN